MNSSCCFLTRTKPCFVKRPFCSFLLFSGACLRALFHMGMESFRSRCKALFHMGMESFRSRCKALFGSRGCFGCFSKPSAIIAASERSKRMRIQDQMVKRTSLSDDFWSTSTGEMDTGTSNQPLDHCSNAGSTSNPSEFVNHGLLQWNQMRQQWLGSKRSQNRPQVQEPTISWNASYESLLGTNKPFPTPVPLAEMVDFLVDIWKEEGLYD